MKPVYILLIVIVVVLVAWHARWYFLGNVEHPEPIATKELWNIKVVTMPAQIVATVRTEWDIAWAPSNAFWQLAWFIFGDNQASDKIAMTAPVTSTIVESQKIAMTAPVTSSVVNEWVIETAFIMPSKRTMETLPVPNNKNITIKELPATEKYVWTFSWYATKDAVATQRAAFEKELQDATVTRSWEPTLAQYNDPRTPPRMRRNELWVSVE